MTAAPARVRLWAALFWLLWVCAWGTAQAQQAVPALTGHVVDQAGALDAATGQKLEQTLADFERQRGTQIVLLLVKDTAPEDIASYANRVGNSWKIGRKAVGDGVLLIVATDARRLRIEVAKSLEGAIPDLAAKRIIDEAITPRFKQGDYAGGLEAGVQRIMALVRGEALPPPPPAPAPATTQGRFGLVDLALFVFFAVPVLGGLIRSVLGARLGALVTGVGVGALALTVTSSLLLAGLAGVIALVITLFANLSNSLGGWLWGSGAGGGGGGGGSGGDSGGGGGFSSGGGGDFGGGGASGDW